MEARTQASVALLFTHPPPLGVRAILPVARYQSSGLWVRFLAQRLMFYMHIFQLKNKNRDIISPRTSTTHNQNYGLSCRLVPAFMRLLRFFARRRAAGRALAPLARAARREAAGRARVRALFTLRRRARVCCRERRIHVNITAECIHIQHIYYESSIPTTRGVTYSCIAVDIHHRGTPCRSAPPRTASRA